MGKRNRKGNWQTYSFCTWRYGNHKSKGECKNWKRCFQISLPHGYDLKNIYNKIRKEKIDSIESIFKGWEKDSIYYSSKEKADSIVFAIDYWEASEWVDMSVNPEDHCWWGDLDTATYSKLESALCEEIAKPNFSSRAEDYMKLDTYKRYKAYLCENADYINLMFQGFLFTEPATGLCGFLVDDIVRSRYPCPKYSGNDLKDR